MKTAWLFLLIASLTIACNSQTPPDGKGAVEEPQESFVETTAFSDPESGIRFELPEGGYYLRKVESPSSTENSVEKVVSFRIQNYDPKQDLVGLSEDQYYIELSIDYADVSPNAVSCADALTELETAEAVEGARYMGYPDQGGDSGGERYAICSDSPVAYNYYLQITENNPSHPVREKVKNSLFVE